MKETELKKAYARACQTRGYEPSEGQFKTWKQTMMFFESVDIERAIDLWYESSTTLPMPAELKPLIERARRERTTKLHNQADFVAWKCPECGLTQSGWPEDPARTRYCPRKGDRETICGQTMLIVCRDPVEVA